MFKAALVGGIALGVNEYMYPETTTEYIHEQADSITGDEFTIMTVNVHDWKLDDTIPDASIFRDTTVLQGLRRAINKHDPDVICAQEFAKGKELDELHDDGFNIIHATTVNYPFIKETGNAVLSKLPLQLIEVERLPSEGSYTPRNAIVFEVGVDDENALLMSATHIGAKHQSGRMRQANVMMRNFGDRIHATCGDFNSEAIELEQSAVGALFGARGVRLNSATYPASNPIRGIDHIIMKCGRPIFGSRETFPFGSDHYGVVETYNIANC
jgi:endonuclease/exonuclease/phosphatase family metal-dependent hydrolase